MEVVFSMEEEKKIGLANETIEKWRNILHLDPIWQITVDVYDEEDMPVLARLDTSRAEYYFASIEISHAMLEMEEEEFIEKINKVMCHELVHLAMVDFFRTAKLIVGDNEELFNELRYKYEQITARLQRSFMELYKKVEGSNE